MNSSQIYALIEDIAATSSKNEKIAKLRAGGDDSELLKVLDYAYSPFKTFGIAKMPVGKAHDGYREFDDTTWGILDRLAFRKLTGNEAWDAVGLEIDSLNFESSELFKRILRKDLRAGFSESTINKVHKDLIPEFPYMRCALPKNTDLAKWPWETGVISQEKADGMFANVDVEGKDIEVDLVRITTRQGSEVPLEKLTALESAIKNTLVPGYQYHGELVIVRAGSVCERQIGNGILNSILNGGDIEDGDEVVFYAWDMIPIESVVSKGKYNVAYSRRLRVLTLAISSNRTQRLVRLIPTKFVKSMSDAFAHYRELLARGKEGTVIKHPNAIWKDGTSKEQIKLKLEVDVDLKVVAIVPGKEGGKNEGRAGSLTCISDGGQLQVDVTVKNEDMRNRVDANPEDWIDRIIVVKSNSILYPSESNDLHSLFLPRMVEANYRTDKTEADSLQRVLDQFESAIAA